MKRNQINNEELHPCEWMYWDELPDGFHHCNHTWRNLDDSESVEECIFCGLERDTGEVPNKFIYFR